MNKVYLLMVILFNINIKALEAPCNPPLYSSEEQISMLDLESNKLTKKVCVEQILPVFEERLAYVDICRDLKIENKTQSDENFKMIRHIDCNKILRKIRVPTFCLDELAELKELDEVLKRKQLLQKKNQSEILEDGLTVYINTLILKSQRFPGRGKVSSFLNNAIGISSGIIYENTGKLESTAYLVCIEQASQFLQTEQARYLNHLGFKIEVFDETPKNDSSGKIKHAFVLLTDKSGEKYIFDPWKGYVQKYKDEEFINSKGKRLGLKYYNSKFY